MFRKRSLIGLDLGTYSLKCASSSGKRAVQNLWQSLLMPERTGRDDALATAALEPRVASLFGSWQQTLSETIASVNVVMAGEGTICRYLEFPALSPKELAVAGPAQAMKHIPYPADDVNISLIPVPALGEGKRSGLFFVADQKSRAMRTTQMLGECNLKVNRVEAPVISIFREFIANRALPAGSVHAIVHVGYRLTHLLILRDKHPYYYREVRLAGRDFTYAFQQGEQSTWAEAEAQKIAFDTAHPEVMVEPFLQRFLGEIKKTLKACENQCAPLRVQGISLSGGTAAWKNLDQRISEHVSLPVTVDKWDQIKVDVRYRDAGPDACFKVAAGLTLEE